MSVASIKSRVLLPAFIALAVVAGQAHSANFRWLNFSPARHFTDDDWSMLTETADQALSSGKDGEEFSWSNPKTGNSGSLVPGPATGSEGERCRTLKITNQASGLSSTGIQRLCMQPSGEWKIVSD